MSSRQCDHIGVTMGMRRRLVDDRRWARVTTGVYDVEPARDRRGEVDHRRRRSAWLGMLAYGPDAIAVGACALALHDVRGLPTDVRPEVALPGGAFGKSRDGMRVRQLSAVESTRFGERRIATLMCALLTALPSLGREHAVAVLDDLTHRGRLSPGQMDAVRSRLRGGRDCADVPTWMSLVDGRSESPLETFARIDCIDAGVPPDELQVVIRAPDGTFLGRGDMGWRLPRGRWLIAEIDGREFHDRPDALLRDRARQNTLLIRGAITMLRFTHEDIGSVGRTVREALLLDREQPHERQTAG
ncbi:hypothetical protein [Cellulomonas sp. URHD0024]|uniref:hypothetical protein n=1 Tax=Cellulomonas sp. URHD0024 TaxID=1302620 RepID=UPI0012DE776F|nr:hypothetical protein [Cellulomonas sp. URHD0024]